MSNFEPPTPDQKYTIGADMEASFPQLVRELSKPGDFDKDERLALIHRIAQQKCDGEFTAAARKHLVETEQYLERQRLDAEKMQLGIDR